jgi:hypothetical protein
MVPHYLKKFNDVATYTPCNNKFIIRFVKSNFDHKIIPLHFKGYVKACLINAASLQAIFTTTPQNTKLGEKVYVSRNHMYISTSIVHPRKVGWG